MSLPEVMLFTDKGFESESTSDSPLKSFQNGIFTVVPPSVPKATSTSKSPTMPDCHNADFSAVLFNTYGVNNSGTITSAILCRPLGFTP